MHCHHKLEEYLDAYIRVAGIAEERKRSLFRSVLGKTRPLTARPILRGDVWRIGAPPCFRRRD